MTFFEPVGLKIGTPFFTNKNERKMSVYYKFSSWKSRERKPHMKSPEKWGKKSYPLIDDVFYECLFSHFWNPLLTRSCLFYTIPFNNNKNWTKKNMMAACKIKRFGKDMSNILCVLFYLKSIFDIVFITSLLILSFLDFSYVGRFQMVYIWNI